MSALTTWLLHGPSKSRPSGVPGLFSNSDQGKDRILHGRVTKPIHTNVTAKATKYSAFGQHGEHNKKAEEQDANSESSPDVTVLAEKTDETNQEEDSSDESDDGNGDDSEGNNQEEYSNGLPLAMIARQTHFEGNIDNIEDGTDSESDPDTAWRREQIYLNTILNARNKFTLMPSTWRMHFRGIPLPDSLFYIKTKSKSIRPRIYARTDRLEYRGTWRSRRTFGSSSY